MKYSIIIITNNRLESLKKLVASIEHHTKDYDLIVVNNASSDGTFDWLTDQHARYGQREGSGTCQNISYTESIPVATAWNLGTEVATGDFIQILNDDMEVTEGWLEQQEELYNYLTASGKKVGVLASKLLRGDEILSRGGAFRGTQLVPVPPPEEVKPVDYSNMPFFKRSVWKDVGGFTAHGRIYYEDADFGIKLEAKGYKNYYNPLSVMYHETLGFRPEHGEEEYKRRQHNEGDEQAKSRESFMKKWENYLLNEHEDLY